MFQLKFINFPTVLFNILLSSIYHFISRAKMNYNFECNNFEKKNNPWESIPIFIICCYFQEPPPSYVICMDPSALPSYTDAIKKVSNDSHPHSYFHNQPVQMIKNEETTTSNAVLTPTITQNMHTDSPSSHSNNSKILGEFLSS